MWPLGINKEMDEHAAARGLPHWSCTSPMSNDCWIRRDGEIYRPPFRSQGGYPDELREFDRKQEMGKSAFEETKLMIRCTKPSYGWQCTRENGHSGPCAAQPQFVVRKGNAPYWCFFGCVLAICYTIAIVITKVYK